MAGLNPPIPKQRLFFALVPDQNTRIRIEGLQRKLMLEHHIKGRPVNAGQFHATLAFLGDQPVSRLPSLLELASGLQMPACRVVLDRLGSFQRAGVVWLGAASPPMELCEFQERLAAALDQADFDYDRKPWKFHLTLYRKLRTPWSMIEPDAVCWRLNGFSLIESISVDHGVEYRQLGAWDALSSGHENPTV